MNLTCPPDEPRRLFFSLPLAPDALNSVSAIVSAIQRSRPIRQTRIAWVRPETTHITLVFLGDQPASVISRLAGLTRDSLVETASFHAVLGAPQAFPDARKPRIIALPVLEGASPMISVQKRLATALENAGISFDNKPFRPHLTLGRIKSAPPRCDWPTAFAPAGDARIPCGFDQVVLFSSTLLPDGARHTPEFSVPLGE